MHPFAHGTTRGSCAFQLWGEAGNCIKKEQAVPAFFIHYLGVREGRVMTKQRGPEDLSSCNCQVLLCCQMHSISCPIYFLSLDFLCLSVAGGCCWRGQMWDGRGHAWRRHQQLFRSRATLFAHGWSGLAWEVDGGWRMLGQMWPPKWRVVLCPRGVFSCPFLFHPAPHVVAQLVH